MRIANRRRSPHASRNLPRRRSPQFPRWHAPAKPKLSVPRSRADREPDWDPGAGLVALRGTATENRDHSNCWQVFHRGIVQPVRRWAISRGGERKWGGVMSCTEWQEWRKECTAIEEAMSRLLMRVRPDSEAERAVRTAQCRGSSNPQIRSAEASDSFYSPNPAKWLCTIDRWSDVHFRNYSSGAR